MLTGRAAKNAKIQYWTPNKEITNSHMLMMLLLEECRKRGIEVFFGWK